MMFSNLIIVQGRADRMGVKMSHKYVYRVAKSFVVFFLFGSLLTGCDLLTNAKFMEKFLNKLRVVLVLVMTRYSFLKIIIKH